MKDLVILGDQPHDLAAGESLFLSLPNPQRSRLISFKLMEEPKPSELLSQLVQVAHRWKEFANSD